MNDPNEITVGANGRVLVAPVGTALPASISVAPDAAFIELGYLDEDGVTFTDGKTVEQIKVWQAFYAVRRIVTEKESMVAFNMSQWNEDNVIFAFGGGSVVADVPGSEFTYSPPAPGTIDERVMLVEFNDGLKNYRFVIERGMVTDDVETQLTKGAEGKLPIVFGVNGVDGSDAWKMQTDDPAFDPA